MGECACGCSARLDALEAIVAALQAQQPRDTDDAALRQLLPLATSGLPFTAGELLAHAGVDAELNRVLAGATLQTSGEVGAWLRGQRGHRSGVTIDRLPRRRWRAYTCDTSCARADLAAG